MDRAVRQKVVICALGVNMDEILQFTFLTQSGESMFYELSRDWSRHVPNGRSVAHLISFFPLGRERKFDKKPITY